MALKNIRKYRPTLGESALKNAIKDYTAKIDG